MMQTSRETTGEAAGPGVFLDAVSLQDLGRFGTVVRNLGQEAETMEEVARAVVRLFHDTFRDQAGNPALALARLFVTRPLRKLSPRLQQIAREMMSPGKHLDPQTCCLTLLGSAGALPEWNDRLQSRGHQVIPLADDEMLEQAPMVSALVRTLGLHPDHVLSPEPALLIDLERRTYNVFHVAHARGSSVIPDQDFIRAHGIRSVLGFGGVLPSGCFFACILFSRVSLSRPTAGLFRTLALNVKLALLPFDPEPVFEDDG
jgi:two-component system, NtrC family, sensor kinase